MAKRGQGEGSISKRPDGTWWARITVGKDADGKQKRRAFYGKTRKEVQEKLTAALNEVNNGTYIEPTRMTVEQWMNTWLKEYNRNVVKASTFYRNYMTIQKHVMPKLGIYKLRELRKDMIQKFVNQLLDEGYKASTVSVIYSKLHTALQQAYEDELIQKNPATGVKMPPVIKESKKVLTPKQQKIFIEKAKLRDDDYGYLYILLIATGLRIGEALSLTWDDIDFKEQSLSVNKTKAIVKDVYNKDSQSVGTTLPKTRTSIRKIPLLPSVISMLKKLEQERETRKHKFNNKYLSDFEEKRLIFCTYKGTYLEATRAGRHLKTMLKDCGIQDVENYGLHSLRHTFATRGLEQGVELKVMQEFLGHTKINMTADIYTHVLSDKKNESMMKLQDTVNL